jgi:hypothetical protein
VNADSIKASPAIPGDVIDFMTGGTLVRQFSIDPNAGSGFAILSLQNEFAYVDDFTSNVTIWRLSSSSH